MALSRAAAAEEKLLACEAKLRLAETATTDAENRAGRVKLLADTERHEHRDFEATVSGLKRAILEARAETRAAKAAAEAESKTARESVLFSEAAAREIVEVETKRRVAAERERDDAREDAAFSRKRADSVRAEAERLLERAEIVEDETSFPEEEEKKKNRRSRRGRACREDRRRRARRRPRDAGRRLFRARGCFVRGGAVRRAGARNARRARVRGS